MPPSSEYSSSEIAQRYFIRRAKKHDIQSCVQLINVISKHGTRLFLREKIMRKTSWKWVFCDHNGYTQTQKTHTET